MSHYKGVRRSFSFVAETLEVLIEEAFDEGDMILQEIPRELEVDEEDRDAVEGKDHQFDLNLQR